MTVHIFHWKDYENDRGSAIKSFQDWHFNDVPQSHAYVAFNKEHGLMKYKGISRELANGLALQYQTELPPDTKELKITM